MPRLVCLLALLTAATSTAAPVPKEKPDPLPDGALVRLGTFRYRGPHTDETSFSADGKTLATTDGESTVFRWDVATGKALPEVELDVKGVAASRAVRDRVFLLVPVTRPPAKFPTLDIVVYDLATRKRREFVTPFWGGEEKWEAVWRHVRISADGRWVYGSVGSPSVEVVYDADTGDEVLQLAQQRNRGGHTLSADGKQVFGLEWDEKQTRGWVLRTPTGDSSPAVRMPAPRAVARYAVTPDAKSVCGVGPGHFALKPGEGQKLWVWDAVENNRLAEVQLTGEVWALHPTGNETVFVGEGNRVGVLSLATGKRVWEHTLPQWAGEEHGFFWADVSADGTRVAVSNKASALTVFDTATGKRVSESTAHDGPVVWAGYSADGTKVYTADNTDLRVWDAATGALTATHRPTDDRRVRFGGVVGGVFVWWREDAGRASDAEFVGWSLADAKVAWRVTSPAKRYGYFATVGDKLAVYERERTETGDIPEYVVYDAGGKEVARWTPPKTTHADYSNRHVGHGDEILLDEDAAFNVPTGTVRVSLADGKVLGRFDGYAADGKHYTNARAVSADGKRAAFGDEQGWVVRTLADGTVEHYQAVDTHYTVPLAFSPDGKRLLVRVPYQFACHLVTLADPSNPRRLIGNTQPTTAAFSPDGKRAVVGYRDGTALIWDLSK